MLELPPTPLSIGVILSCSVKGAVHSFVRDLQFLGSFLHEMASLHFTSQNKKKTVKFKKKR